MGSSFVEYRGRGFWSYDGYLEHLLALLAEAVVIGSGEDWLANARDHWLKQASGDFSGWIHPDFDEYLTSDERRERCLGMVEAVRCRRDVTPEVEATAELLQKLLTGRLETDESSPLDYLVTGKVPYTRRAD